MAAAKPDRTSAPGTLYVVGMPIGHDGDLGPRARQVLAEVSCIAAEDTRVTRAALGRLQISAPSLISYHDHNERQRVPGLLRRLLEGQAVALVSDAGMPLVSDPGYRLVAAAAEAQVPITVVPGACAAVAALSASGLPPDRFLVLGFLPRDAPARRAVLGERRGEGATMVLYVSPHRVLEVLADMVDVWGDRRAALARSLTKPHESWLRSTLVGVRAALEAESAEAGSVRGELTLVVEGATEALDLDGDRVEHLIRALLDAGVGVGQVRDVVSAVYDRPRRWVYQRALALRDAGESGEAP